MLRARFALLLSSAVLAATLVPIAPAFADDEPTATPTPDPTTIAETTAPDATPAPGRDEAPSAPVSGVAAATLPDAPAVSISKPATGTTLTATLSGTSTAGLTVKWQWKRNGAAISGATTASHALVAADYGTTLTAVVTISKSGYTAKSATASVSDFSLLRSDGSGGVAGTARVGSTLTPVDYSYKTGTTDPVVPATVTYRWLRSTTVLGTGTSYRLTAADAGAHIFLETTATLPGYLPSIVKDDVGVVQKAVFTGTSIHVTGPTLAHVLTGDYAYTDPWPDLPGAKVTMQWYRWKTGAVAITGATGQLYTITAADQNTGTTFRVTVTKPGYETLVLEDGENYTLIPNGVPVISPIGELKVGGHLVVVNTGYHVGTTGFAPDNSSIQFGYQWLRDGAAIAGAGTSSYTPTTADNGHRLSVRVTATYGGFLPTTVTTAATPVVGVSTFTDSGAGIQLLHLGSPATLSIASTGVTGGGGTSIGYQWLRNNAPIAGATAATYTLTPADWGTATSVRLTFTAPGHTPYVKVSNELDYSLGYEAQPTVASSAPGSYRVGDTLSLVMPDSTDMDGNTVTPAATFQWLRNGTAIAGATSGSYRLQPADKGAKISIRVTAAYEGHNPWIRTSAPTVPIDLGLLVVDDVTPLVTNDDGYLTAALPSGSVHTDDVTYAYQWYRQSGSATPVAVAGQTKATYLLTSADFDKRISVKVTVSKKNVVPASVPLTSIGTDYTIKVAAPAIINGTNRVGGSLVFVDGEYADGTGNDIFPSFTAVQWYRNGVAIAGATSTSYTPVAADLSAALTARVTERLSGYVSRTISAAASGKTALGALQTSGEFLPEVAPGTLTAQLRASVPAGNVLTPGVTYTYQWRRNGAPVTGATTSTFTLLSTDATKTISVVVTTHKAGYANLTSETAPRTWALQTSQLMAIYSAPFPGLVGVPLYIGVQPGWKYAYDGSAVTPAKVSYQWYRQATPTSAPIAITGATGATYTLVAADYGWRIVARQYVSGPGFVGTSTLSGVTDPTVGLGQNLPGHDGTATVTMNAATNTLTASLQAGSLLPATPAPVLSYQWYRKSGSDAAVPITGATKSSYTLNNGTDYQKLVYVVIRVKRDKFTLNNNGHNDSDYTLSSPGKNYTSLPGPQVQFSATPVFGAALVAPTPTWVDANGNIIGTPATLSYQWLRASDSAGNGFQIITGATKATYTPTLADIGKYLTVTYSAKIPGYLTPPHPSAKFSNQVQAASLQWNGQLPIIAGTSTPSLKLTAVPPANAFGVAPTTYTYQWGARLEGSTGEFDDIPGATGQTYTLSMLYWSYEVSVRVTASRSGYAPVAMQALIPVSRSIHSTQPTISPTTNVHTDTVISATAPTLTPAPSGTVIRYQWYRYTTPANLAAIPGATSAQYKVTAADVGYNLLVETRASNPAYLAAFAASASTATVTLATLGHPGEFAPTVSVANSTTMQLKINYSGTGQFSPAATSYTYQWYRRGPGGSTATTPIAGATSTSYTLTQADISYAVFARVTAHRAGYLPYDLDTLPTGYSLTMDQPVITWSGNARPGEVFTAHPGALSAVVFGETYSYQWYRQNPSTLVYTKLTGATAATYKAVAGDAGQRIVVRVHVMKAGYLTQTYVQSNPVSIPMGA